MIQNMMGWRKTLVMGGVLVAAMAQPVGAQSAPAEQAKMAGAPAAPTVRPEVGALATEVQRLLINQQPKEAASKLASADAIKDKTPYEMHVFARLKGVLAATTDDAEMAVQAYGVASQGPWLQDPDKVKSLYTILSLYYNAKNYDKAFVWMDRYRQAGGNDPIVDMLRAQSYYLMGDYANAAQAMASERDKASAAGSVLPEKQFKLLADSHRLLKDKAAYTQDLETIVRHYPSQANWRLLLDRLWAKENLSMRLQLDIFRLQLATSGIQEASDFTDMAELAFQAGSTAEASAVVQQGYAAGVLGVGEKALAHQRLKDKMSAAAAQDRASLEKDVLRAKTLPDGVGMFNYGFNMFHQGLTERGIAQMEQGLAKGIPRNIDQARLRLVAAYAKAGQRDKAKQILLTLAGKTDPVGMDDTVRYWNLFLSQP